MIFKHSGSFNDLFLDYGIRHISHKSLFIRQTFILHLQRAFSHNSLPAAIRALDAG